MAGQEKSRRIHLEIQRHRRNPIGVFRTTYYKDGKILHDNLGSISGLDIDMLRIIQATLQGETVMKSDFRVKSGKEHGASYAFLTLAKKTGLDKMIYSRTSEQWVKGALAMIAGRVVYAGSRLFLTRVNSTSTLWEQVGVHDDVIDVNSHCYDSMDKLFARQDAIQKNLAKKHLTNGVLILYDITSTYMEGEYSNSEIVGFGYNRDKKQGHEQINIGLLCNRNGCPVAVQVFKGGKKDTDTVTETIEQLKREFGLKDIVFVGDRGMITQMRLSDMAPNKEHVMLKISALTHARMKALCDESKNVQLSMFDETQPIEVVLPDRPGMRYALCLNPVRAEKERLTRLAMIERTKRKLEQIAVPKRKTSDGKLGMRVGKVLSKSKVGKFFDIEIRDGKVDFSVNEGKVREEEKFDGHYVIFTDVPAEQLTIQEVVDSYRALISVEQAFRNLKSPVLEIRSVFHRTDDRIRCHVFLCMCMLSYYLLWHMKQRLKPLFEEDSTGRRKQYTVEHVINTLKNIQKQEVEFQGIESVFVSEPNDEQNMILDLLDIRLT
jgi:transposase